MLKLENTEVLGWEHAIRGMRNPMNSWEKSDSRWEPQFDTESGPMFGVFVIGPNDLDLMKRLRNAGTDHRKFMRMITVYVDITGPLYWWKEFKTYRAGRKFGDDEPDVLPIPEDYLEFDIEMNSCSTMHKIAAKEFTLEDFSCEHLSDFSIQIVMKQTIDALNHYRNEYLETIETLKNANLSDTERHMIKDYQKCCWWQMIQLLPSSYNQRRTVMLNYEVLANIYKSRRNHKLDEWHTFCDWIERLPYSELITGKFDEEQIKVQYEVNIMPGFTSTVKVPKNATKDEILAAIAKDVGHIVYEKKE